LFEESEVDATAEAAAAEAERDQPHRRTPAIRHFVRGLAAL